MSFLEPELHFDSEGPFHRLVVAYVAQVHGMLDLAARGLRVEWQCLKVSPASRALSEKDLVDLLSSGAPDGYADHVRAVLNSESGAISGVQRLGARCGTGVKVDTAKLAHEVFRNPHRSLAAFAVMSAGSLLVLAWESTLADHTRDPLWEFLRHCRNASAHKGGRFNFLGDEPRRPAQWRSLEIVDGIQGTPLFFDSDGKGLMGPGDALYLLADIENRFYGPDPAASRG